MALTFDQQLQERACKLRGAYLNMACDLEFMLVDIACVSLVKDKTERDNVRNILMEQATMSKKITWAKRALKKFDEQLHDKYVPNFEKFRELTGWRNKFAHSMINGDKNEKDLSFLIFHYIKDGEMVTQIENVNELYNKLLEYASYLHNMMNEVIPAIYNPKTT